MIYHLIIKSLSQKVRRYLLRQDTLKSLKKWRSFLPIPHCLDKIIRIKVGIPEKRDNKRDKLILSKDMKNPVYSIFCGELGNKYPIFSFEDKGYNYELWLRG